MSAAGGERGSAPLVIVVLASMAGSLGFAWAARSAGAGVSAADGCAAARSLARSSTVAVVDSGIERSALPGATFAGARIERTGSAGTDLAPHGTEMASIISAAAPSARLVDVRVLDDDGSGSAASVADGIDAASRAGAEVINLSAAVPASDPAIRSAVARAVDGGGVVVIAAGNDARDLDRDPAWRSLAADPCVVVVGALGADGDPLPASNRGDRVVETWVPGEDVEAIGPGGRPTEVTGTSPAAASASAGLLAT